MNMMQITNQGSHLLLTIEPFPEWEQFIDWGTAWLTDSPIEPPWDISEGADRHMVVFTFNRARFSLNYENYTQSIWITPEESAADDLLEQLQLTLQTPSG